MEQMTMRERLTAFVRREEMDRVPFAQYSGIACASNEEIWATVGRENVGILRGCHAHRFEHPNCGKTSEEMSLDGKPGLRETLHTPKGTLVQEVLREPTFGTYTRHKSFVQEPEDYEILIAYLRDTQVVQDFNGVERVLQELGEDGIPHTWLGRTPYQQTWIEWVRMEDFALHLLDCPDIVEECMELMGNIMRRIFQAIKNAPIPYADIGDNITAPIIGEHYFKKYCVPYYNELADVLSERNIPVFVHADGDLKPLWKAIGESKVGGLDSFSPLPDNDTSVREALQQWPEMRLGMNFPSSIHLCSPEEIRAKTAEILEEGGHSGRLQVQISENMPPCVWRKSYPEIIAAIEEFGKP